MQAQMFEPMSIGRILDQTFKIYKDHFIRFITIVAIIQIPVGLLMITSQSFFQGNILRRNQSLPVAQTSEQAAANSADEQTDESEAASASILFFIGTAVSMLLTVLGNILCSGALAKNVSESYLGNDISVGETYGFVLPKFLTLIGAGILIVLCVWAGFIMLIVPGIIFSLWFYLTTPAIVLENHNVTAGMSRSKALAKGNLGKIFSVVFLIGIISLVIAIPFNFLGGMFSVLMFRGNAHLMIFITQMFSVTGQIIVAPIGAVAMILLYYDLRIRKEGFDLQMLANSIRPSQI